MTATNGIVISNTAELWFNIINGTHIEPGWSMLVGVQAQVGTTIWMEGNDIAVELAPGNFTYSVDVLESHFGSISAPDFF